MLQQLLVKHAVGADDAAVLCVIRRWKSATLWIMGVRLLRVMDGLGCCLLGAGLDITLRRAAISLPAKGHELHKNDGKLHIITIMRTTTIIDTVPPCL